MMRRLSGILIGGSSHVGKTTLARRLAEALGWNMVSTDSLARHPGRPWPSVRQPVAEYYARLSPETIYWFLRVHHENMWPGIRRIIEEELQAGRPFVFEGSALRPESIAPLVSEAIAGVFLHADNDFLQERMQSEAGYRQAGEADRRVMDSFIERSLRDNSEMRADAEKHGLRMVDVADAGAVTGLFDELVPGA
ncbi:AAA family ATPase [Rhizobium puerariae]|uniref:AAA family ATPase n=1 Tax=Rhizobium puerariae TaxID=1585791 RepID=A0ABV6A9G1_9HYPH